MSTLPPWEADPFPGRFYVPTMLTHHEVNYLHWLSRRHHRGRGRIVELGCFLGGSTMALARGLANNPTVSQRLLTYDSFVMDGFAAEAFLHPYTAGDRFRALFDVYTSEHADLVEVREGWIPEDLPRDREADLYPEQAAVDVLFVDAAKTWGVHLTAMRAFGRHMSAGSILVQQDFKNPFVHWIPIHMFELRRWFEPVHDVPVSASIGFRRLGGDAPFDSLSGPRTAGADSIDALWDEIEEFWRSFGSHHAVTTVKLNRVTHMAAVGRVDDAVESLERLPEWIAGLYGPGIRRVAVAELRATVSRLAHSASRREDISSALTQIENRATQGLPLMERDRMSALQRAVWAQVAERCRDLGLARIALYGAGRHTRELLQSGWPGAGLSVVAALDDLPKASSINGVAVCAPEALDAPVDVVIASSDSVEDEIFEAAEAIFGPRGTPVWRFYGCGASRRLAPAAR